jgi:2,3-bisphosphoglycerate-dependent phosphoglycerate mutase
MKIFILRHEDRTQDASFFSPLTKAGLENSIKLIPILENLQIKYVYSSPFIRTLQTVYPYLKQSNTNVKLDYGLSEIKHEDLIPKWSHTTRLPEYMNENFLVDSNYKGSVEPEDITFPEKEIDVQKRVKVFLKNIISNHLNTDDTILIVTHQVVCNIILKIIYKYGKEKPPVESANNYPKGAVSLVFDNLEWTFKPINWKIK